MIVASRHYIDWLFFITSFAKKKAQSYSWEERKGRLETLNQPKLKWASDLPLRRLMFWKDMTIINYFAVLSDLKHDIVFVV